MPATVIPTLKSTISFRDWKSSLGSWSWRLTSSAIWMKRSSAICTISWYSRPKMGNAANQFGSKYSPCLAARHGPVRVPRFAGRHRYCPHAKTISLLQAKAFARVDFDDPTTGFPVRMRTSGNSVPNWGPTSLTSIALSCWPPPRHRIEADLPRSFLTQDLRYTVWDRIPVLLVHSVLPKFPQGY